MFKRVFNYKCFLEFEILKRRETMVREKEVEKTERESRRKIPTHRVRGEAKKNRRLEKILKE